MFWTDSITKRKIVRLSDLWASENKIIGVFSRDAMISLAFPSELMTGL